MFGAGEWKSSGVNALALIPGEPAQHEMTVQDLLRHTSGLICGIFGKSLVKTLDLRRPDAASARSGHWAFENDAA